MIRATLLALALLLAGPVDAAKTLIVNANGYTLDQGGGMLRFATLLVGDDGKVLAAFPRGASEPKLAAGDFRLDARGRTLIPGLIDAHGHVMHLGLALRRLDLAPATSLADAQTRISAHAAANGASAWILGRGWNQERWGLGRPPTAAELDAATPGRPAWLQSESGSAGWANSAAMKLVGIGKATKDPPGGRILRDAAGQPSGVLLGTAMDLVAKAIPPPTAGEQEEALKAALAHLASVGLTGVHDMGVTPEAWALLRGFADTGQLTVRITGYARGMEAMEAISPLRPTPWLYADRLRLQGIKFAADGSLGRRTAHLLQPYSDAPATRGPQLFDDARMKNLFSRANYLGYQIAVHAVGDAANKQVLDSFADIRPTYGDRHRNRIEHLQLIDPADIKRMAEFRIIASLQPMHAVSGRVMVSERIGELRLAGAFPMRTLRDAGVRLALGLDDPTTHANPFLGLHGAVTRQDRPGQPENEMRAPEALTLAQAFAGFTRDAAFAGGMETKVGTLEPGRWADFLLLDRDPFAIFPDDLPEVVVEETWLAGQRVFVRARP